jgi:hypothetical protein
MQLESRGDCPPGKRREALGFVASKFLPGEISKNGETLARVERGAPSTVPVHISSVPDNPLLLKRFRFHLHYGNERKHCEQSSR